MCCIVLLDREKSIDIFSPHNVCVINRKAKMLEKLPVIKAYINPYCPWSPGVRTALDNAGLAYEILDITKNKEAFSEMVEKSRQYSSPCVEIDGQMLADVGGEEVEAWLRQHGFS